MRLIYILFVLLFTLPAKAQQPNFVTIPGGDLYKLDIATCSAVFVGSTGQGFGDIAFTNDGRLWGIVIGDLYRIDTTTASATLIGQTNVGAVSLVGLNDSVLLAEYNMNLYAINVNTASSSLIDSIGYQAAGDLTWYDNDLYLTTGTQELVRIVLNQSNTAIVSVTVVNAPNNPIPICEGAATISTPNDYNILIGYSANLAYRICPNDGTFEVLCNILPEGGIPGGATIRLPVQNPLPAVCSLVGVTDYSQNSGLSLSPNPFTESVTLQSETELRDAELRICNVQGEVVQRIQSVAGKSVTIPRNALPAGIYFLQVSRSDKAVATLRLVVLE